MSTTPTIIGRQQTTSQIEDIHVRNAHLILQAVAERFPEWAPYCRPYVNVLTLEEWNRRGYRVKKGESAIRVGTLVPVWTQDNTTGQTVQSGTRWQRAYLFAEPQVSDRGVFRPRNTNAGRHDPASDAVFPGSDTTPVTASAGSSMNGISGTTLASSTP